ncbi:hypothetical protein D3C78_1870390 [compost metagenome]
MTEVANIAHSVVQKITVNSGLLNLRRLPTLRVASLKITANLKGSFALLADDRRVSEQAADTSKLAEKKANA